MSAMHTPTASRHGRHLHEIEAFLALIVIAALVLILAQQNAAQPTAGPVAVQNEAVAATSLSAERAEEHRWQAARTAALASAAQAQQQESAKDRWMEQRGVIVGAPALTAIQRQEELKDRWLERHQ